MRLKYQVGTREVSVTVPIGTTFFSGENVCLSSISSDPTRRANWYGAAGYSVISHQALIPHGRLFLAIENIIIQKIRREFPNKDLSRFSLENYHKFVSEREHSEVLDRQVKRLYSDDLDFNDHLFTELLMQELDVELSYTAEKKANPHWIIVRILTPGSNAFNPPHKDIYEAYDHRGEIPKMVNCWVPICGVGINSGLALAPGSHLLPESQVVRTRAGAEVNGNKFSVNCVKSWGGSTSLINAAPPEGSMLIFSSHLIHGLGINTTSKTRVALEFRLHEV